MTRKTKYAQLLPDKGKPRDLSSVRTKATTHFAAEVNLAADQQYALVIYTCMIWMIQHYTLVVQGQPTT